MDLQVSTVSDTTSINSIFHLHPHDTNIYQSFVGFILVHVAIVRFSPVLVRETVRLLDMVSTNDRKSFNDAAENLLRVMVHVNDILKTMWTHSNHEEYLKFRTFIMGTKNQVITYPSAYTTLAQITVLPSSPNLFGAANVSSRCYV